MKLSTAVPIRHNRLRLPQGVLFWSEAGQGDAIIFLHGTWQDSSQWYPLIEALAPHYHCIAPDLLGFGESSAATSPYSIGLEVESLQALLTPLRVQRFYIVAHSLGAWVAFSLAQRYPDRVKGIVAIAPEGFASEALRGRWRLDQWLTAPWSPLAWMLSGLHPLLSRSAQRGGLRPWQQRRQRLRHNPAACQLLFRRRHSEIWAELIYPQTAALAIPLAVVEPDHSSTPTHHLTMACLQAFPQATHHLLPMAENPLELKHEALGDVIRQMVSPTAAAARSGAASSRKKP